MPTEFEMDNALFSDLAHKEAELTIYPDFFQSQDIKIVSTSGYHDKAMMYMDSAKAVDRILEVKCNMPRRMKFTVQERFRRSVTETGFKPYKARDVTITAVNNETGEPAELYKFECDYFVYGYFDSESNSFFEVLICNIPRLKYLLTTNQIPFQTEVNKKKQTFITITFDNLIKAGIAEYHFNNPPKDNLTMSSFQTTGKLIKAGQTEAKSDKFQVRELVIEIPGNYPQPIAFQLAQDRCGLLDDYSEGEEITVHFDLRGREWNGKYFTNLNAWKLERANPVASPQPEQPAAPGPAPIPAAPAPVAPTADTLTEEPDELPF